MYLVKVQAMRAGPNMGRSDVRNVRTVNKIHHSKTLVKGSDDHTRKQGER